MHACMCVCACMHVVSALIAVMPDPPRTISDYCLQHPQWGTAHEYITYDLNVPLAIYCRTTYLHTYALYFSCWAGPLTMCVYVHAAAAIFTSSESYIYFIYFYYLFFYYYCFSIHNPFAPIHYTYMCVCVCMYVCGPVHSIEKRNNDRLYTELYL